MPNIKFRGTKILSFSLRGQTNGWMLTVKMRADLSKPVIQKMEGWESVLLSDDSETAFREGWTEIALDGKIEADKITLAPNGQFAKFGFSLQADSIGSFHAVKIDSEEGKATKYCLEFTLKTSADLAEAQFGAYWRRVGDQGAALRVGFTEQAELDLEAAESAEPAEAAGPALASAREMTAPRGRKAN